MANDRAARPTAKQVARLREVAETLLPCARDAVPAGAELDALWERTRAALVELADGATAPDAAYTLVTKRQARQSSER